MCYNIRVDATREEIAEYFRVNDVSLWPGPQNRLTIGQTVPIIQGQPDQPALGMMYWGFTPRWEKDPKGGMRPGNARAETLASTPMFRQAFRERRMILPATAFFEWIGEKGKKQLLPFRVGDQPIFGLPGVWDTWQLPDGTERRSFATITCPPTLDVAAYHNRMPVILGQSQSARWLSPETDAKALLDLLVPYPEGRVTAYPAEAYKP